MLQEEGAARSWTKVKDCLLDVIAKKKKKGKEFASGRPKQRY